LGLDLNNLKDIIMKKVLALALLSSMTFVSVQAMDMDKMKTCLKMCMVPAACMMMQRMMASDVCPMRGQSNSSDLLGNVTDRLVDGSSAAALQRVFSPLNTLGVQYSNDMQSVAVDSAVNALVLEADSRLGLSAKHPKLQALVSTSAGKLAYVSILNALARVAYTYVQNQVAPAAASVVKK
jgi:hypothetical protein